jgi:flagellar biosynthesis/type III secretory pathway protein FliH
VAHSVARSVGPLNDDPASRVAASGSDTARPADPAIACDAADATAESAVAAREARFFRAALADVFAAILAQLVRDVADEVLARELHLEAAAIELIARRLIAERLADEPLRLHVAPSDAQVSCTLPVVADACLQPGDAILVCRNGTIDARLAVRLSAVVSRLAP